MKYAWFPGCKIPYYLPRYGQATRSVLAALKVELTDIEFNCCGYPVRHQSFEAFILSAARNMALAESKQMNIVTPCKCCFGNLKHAEHWLMENETLRSEINRLLAQENLKWKGAIHTKHLLSVLAEDVGMDAIQSKIRHRYGGLKVAAHYGCHALRPANVVQFDNPHAPTLFEKLVEITGARCVEWARRLDCCGNPLWDKNNRRSLSLMQKKLTDAAQSGAHVLCTACTYCQLQFDKARSTGADNISISEPLLSVLYPQLLGLSMGLPEKALGFDGNPSDLGPIREYLA